MKKKLLLCSFLAAILAMGLILSTGILFAGPSAAGANEKLSAAPVLFDKEGKLNDRYLADAAAWINDHFFGRQELISMNNRLSALLFGTSGNDSVILGKDGWLYYASTLDNYTGENTMTHRELFSAANNLRLMAAYCESQGKDFAFMIAPNKNSLYPEHMPNYGVISSVHDAQKLHKLLDQMEVPYVDLFTAFRAEEETLYFATDSHWHSKGAALGADLINAAFGVKSSYYHSDFGNSADYTGDLYEMLYPAFSGTEQQPIYAGELNFTYSGNATRPDSITLQTKGQGESNLLCYRDSFGNLLYPYLAYSYADSRFSRSNTYDLTLDADHVLIELVERNLRYLITYAPVMPSPAIQMALPKGYAGAAEVSHAPKVRAPKGYDAWIGTLPNADDHATAYLLWDGQCYEAFLLEDGAFAVYLPEGATAEALVIRSGDTTQVYNIS